MNAYFLTAVLTLFTIPFLAAESVSDPTTSVYEEIASPQETSDLISQLVRSVVQQEGKYIKSALEDPSSLETVEVGTLLFLGTSMENIEKVFLRTQDGTYSQLNFEEGPLSLTPSEVAIELEKYLFAIAYTPVLDAENAVNSMRFPLIEEDENSFLNPSFYCHFLNEQHLPLIVSPKEPTSLETFIAWAADHQEEFQKLLSKEGAILLRGFPISSPEDFANTIRCILGKELIDYKGEGSRTRIIKGVYTSTEAPADFKIPLHNELSCTIHPIDYISFYCDIAPETGTGQTLLGRTEDISNEIKNRPHIWDMFYGKKLKYVSRHPPEGNFFTMVNPTHKTWQSAFDTTDSSEIPKICEQKGYEYTWNGDWVEVTRYVPAIIGPDKHFDHPYWFNQAYLYHPNPRLRGGWTNHFLANMLYIVPSTRQYDIAFEDGSEIPNEVMYEIYDVLDEQTIYFSWKEQDVLILDNHKVLHGKAPSYTPRRILTTMVQ